MKILVFTKNWIGDVVFQLPVLDVLQKHYPQAEITCIAPKRCHGILKMHSAVCDVVEFDEKTTHRSFFSKWKFIRDLKKRGSWDRAYVLHKSKTRAWILKSAGIPFISGYQEGRKQYLTHAVNEPIESVHHVDYHLNLMEACHLSTEGFKNYRLTPPADAVSRVEKKLDELVITDFCCFHLGANWEPKRWPLDHWAKLCDLIWEKYKLPIILTGGAGDQPLADEFLKKRKSAQVISLVGETSLEDVAALFQKARFLVTADSGPMHIASAVGCSVLALFGPTNPSLTGPRGTGKIELISYVPKGFESPFYGSDFPEEGWMECILPEDVFEKVSLL